MLPLTTEVGTGRGLRVSPAPALAPAAERSAAGRDRSYRFRLLAADASGLLAAATISLVAGTHIGFVTAPMVVVTFKLLQLYTAQPRPTVLDQVSRIALAIAAAGLVAGAVVGSSSTVGLMYATIATITVMCARATAFTFERRRLLTHPQRVLIAGTGAVAQEFADRLLRHPEYGMTPVGFIDQNPDPIDPDLDLPVLGGPSALSHVVLEFKVDRVVVDGDAIRDDDLLSALNVVTAARVEVAVLPSLSPHLSSAIAVEGVAGLTLLAYRPSSHRGAGWWAKRSLDVVVASALIVLGAPFFALVALAIKLDSSGPVLFSQLRIGRRGRAFRLFKFRSMVPDAELRLTEIALANEADGPFFKCTRDPRITRVGRFIRRTSIDELPQLLNVIRGEMSLVGPRPALPAEVAEFPDWFQHRLEVPPGLTGLWQVSGRFLLPFYEAARLDVYYVDHWSFGLDLKILARTPSVVLSGRGAR
ncbi:MAG: hypothetical protein QOG03_1840 [Actinomycetota bacterium]|nr:hypothetical protein [Actinomycetota bacterium]